jgi:hypothetical protein
MAMGRIGILPSSLPRADFAISRFCPHEYTSPIREAPGAGYHWMINQIGISVGIRQVAWDRALGMLRPLALWGERNLRSGLTSGESVVRAGVFFLSHA